MDTKSLVLLNATTAVHFLRHHVQNNFGSRSLLLDAYGALPPLLHAQSHCALLTQETKVICM
jgi:hypothetical protein